MHVYLNKYIYQNKWNEWLIYYFMAAYCINTLMGLKHSTPYEVPILKDKLLCSVSQILTKSIILTNITYVSFNKYYVSCPCIAVLSFQRHAKLFLNTIGKKYKNRLITKHIFNEVSLRDL